MGCTVNLAIKPKQYKLRKPRIVRFLNCFCSFGRKPLEMKKNDSLQIPPEHSTCCCKNIDEWSFNTKVRTFKWTRGIVVLLWVCAQGFRAETSFSSPVGSGLTLPPASFRQLESREGNTGTKFWQESQACRRNTWGCRGRGLNHSAAAFKRG